MKFKIGQTVLIKPSLKTDGSYLTGEIYGAEKANGFYLGVKCTKDQYKVVGIDHLTGKRFGNWYYENELEIEE